MVGSGRGTGMGAAALLPLAGWSMAGLGTERSTLRITASRSGEGMPAAFSAGAAGGTTIQAKGTGTKLARKFLGVSLAAEKEMVFILTRIQDRTPIMKAVMAQAGMQTKAQSVAFSMPVTDLAGLRQLEEDV